MKVCCLSAISQFIVRNSSWNLFKSVFSSANRPFCCLEWDIFRSFRCWTFAEPLQRVAMEGQSQVQVQDFKQDRFCGVYFTFWKFDPASFWFEHDFFFDQTRHKIVCSFPSFRGFAEDIRICHGSAGNARWPDPCRKQLPRKKSRIHACHCSFFFWGGVWGGRVSCWKGRVTSKLEVFIRT